MKESTEEEMPKFKDIRDKMFKGLTIAFEKLVAERAKEDGYLVLYQDGKITHVPAKDLLNDSPKNMPENLEN